MKTSVIGFEMKKTFLWEGVGEVLGGEEAKEMVPQLTQSSPLLFRFLPSRTLDRNKKTLICFSGRQSKLEAYHNVDKMC